MELRPKGNMVLVEVDKTDEMTSGGLWIPKSAQEASQIRMSIGKIIKMGPTVEGVFEFNDDEDRGSGNELRHLKIGDRIWFAKYGGCRFETVKDRDFRMINDEDVMALVD